MKTVATALSLLIAVPALAAPRGVEPSGDVDAAYAPRRVALLIGVDKYADADLQTLSFAGKDAVDLAAVLQSGGGGGFEVRVLTGEGRTTRAQVMGALHDATADLQRDDTFLLYLSGHGTLTLDPIDGTQLYFLPSDASLDRPAERGVRVDELEKELSQLVPRRRVLILDTCHNGRSKSGLSESTRERLAGMRGDPPAPRAVTEVSESEARLFAAQHYQPAMEDKDLQNGVYTHFLIEALGTGAAAADLDRDGLVDVAEAHDYAQSRTVTHTGGLQVPRAEYRIVGNQEIFLAGDPAARRKAESALFSAYAGLLVNTRLLVDGQARGELPGLYPVEPGRHTIAVQTDDGRTVSSRKVNVRAGAFHHLEDYVTPHDRSQWTLSAGVVVVHGPGAPQQAPVAFDLEAGWNTAPSRSLLVPGAYVRASLGSGHPADLDVRALSGFAGAGTWVGVMPGEGRYGIGPQLEVVSTWRSFRDATGTHNTAALGVAPGLRARAALPLGRANELLFRYDVRVVPWRVDVLSRGESGWTSAVAHGLSVGASF